MRRLENRVALMAGGATGIGAACAERLIAERCAVVIGVRFEARLAEEARQ